MSENESSPGWLLPLIVIILIASIVLLFVASRPATVAQRQGAGGADFREGALFRLPQLSSPTDPVNPCSLVNQSEVEEILGRELSAPQEVDLDNPIGEKLCVFNAPGNPDQRLLVVDVVFQEGMLPVMRQNDYDVIELYRGRKIQDRPIEEVSGIEDDAFWGGTGAEIWSGLHVRSADVYMRVMVYSEDDSAAFEAAREVAVIVLRNLFD
jgi:hypothetical protein